MKHGDTVIFEKCNDCESGKHCVVMVNGNDATFKKVVKNEENGTLTLQPLNPTYNSITYTKEQIKELPVKILGIAKEKRTKID